MEKLHLIGDKGEDYVLSVPVSLLIYTLTELVVCLFGFIKSPQLKMPIVIFMILSLMSQVVGYGFNIGWLKIYSSMDNGHGISYNFLVGTVFPLIFAFAISYIYKKFRRRGKV